MPKDLFKNQQSKREKLAVRVKIAKPEDWQAYKELRILAITGKDREMFGVASDPKRVEEENSRSDAEWQDDLSRPDRFVVLLLK